MNAIQMCIPVLEHMKPHSTAIITVFYGMATTVLQLRITIKFLS